MEKKAPSLMRKLFKLVKQRRTKERDLSLETIVQHDPQHVSAKEAKRATVYARARKLTQSEHWHEAILAWEEACTVASEDDSIPYLRLARCHAELKNSEAVIAIAREGRERWPDESKFYAREIRALAKLGQINEAQHLGEQLAKLDPEHDVLIETKHLVQQEQALEASRSGRWEEAADAWSQLHAMSPNDTKPLLSLMRIKAEQGEHNETLALAREGRERWPDQSAFSVHEIRSLVNLGRISEAAALGEQLRRIDPEYELPLEAKRHVERERALEATRLERWEEAAEAWTQLYAMSSNDSKSLLSLLRIRIEQNKYEEAVVLAQEGRERWPNKTAFRAHEMRALVKLGRMGEAAEAGEQLARHNPDHEVLKELLETIVQHDPQHASAKEAKRATVYARARKLTQSEHWHEAILAWEEACTVASEDDSIPYLRLARCHAELKNSEAVIAIAREGRERWPDESKFYNRELRALARMGRFVEVQALGEQLAELAPEHDILIEVQRVVETERLAQQERAHVAGQNSRWEEAADAWTKLRALSIYDPKPVLSLLQVRIEQGEHNEVLALAREGQELWPDLNTFHAQEVRALVNLGRVSEANVLREQLASLDPEHEVLFEIDCLVEQERALEASRLGRWPEAVEAWTKLHALLPDDAAPLLSLMQIRIDQGNHEELLVLAQEGRGQWPDQSTFHAQEIRALLNLGRTSEAEALSRQLARLEPEHAVLFEVERNQAYNHAHELSRTGRWAEAAKAWNSANSLLVCRQI